MRSWLEAMVIAALAVTDAACTGEQPAGERAPDRIQAAPRAREAVPIMRVQVIDAGEPLNQQLEDRRDAGAGDAGRFEIGDAGRFEIGDAGRFEIGDAGRFNLGDGGRFEFGDAGRDKFGNGFWSTLERRGEPPRDSLRAEAALPRQMHRSR